MALSKENPALGAAAGLPSGLSFSGDTQDSAPNPRPTQDISRNPVAVREARLELLREDLTCNASAMIATLEAALAMRAADDDCGLIYSLRRARAYWRAISGSAAELISTEAERQSALRQEAAR